MDMLRFVYVYSIFDIKSLFSNIHGVYLHNTTGNWVLKSEDSLVSEDEVIYEDISIKTNGIFFRNTNFAALIKNINGIRNLYLVDANDLTEEQINQLLEISSKNQIHVTVLSHKFLKGSKVETSTYKALDSLSKKEKIIKKRISYVCRCGTSDVSITKERNMSQNSRVYEIHGTKWYTLCNLYCNDVDIVRMNEDNINDLINSREMREFIDYMKRLKS